MGRHDRDTRDTAVRGLHADLRHDLSVPCPRRRHGRQLEPLGDRRDEPVPSVRRAQLEGHPQGCLEPRVEPVGIRWHRQGSSRASSSLQMSFVRAQRGRSSPRWARPAAAPTSTSTARTSRRSARDPSIATSRQVVFTCVFRDGGTHTISLGSDRPRHAPAGAHRCIRRGPLADCKTLACVRGVS